MKNIYFILIILLSCFSSIANGSRSEDAPETGFASSPNDVSQLLSTLERENASLIPQTFLTPFFKGFEHDVEEMAKRTGNNFGIEYIPLYEYSSFGRPHENASGGELEIFGHYRPLGYENNATQFGYKVEQKHAYGKIPPGEFREEINSIIKTTSGYENLKPAITELWFQQIIVDDLLVTRLGKVDVTSVMNSYAFDSRKFYFLSDVFTKHPAIAVPAKALGLVVALKLKEHVYIAATMVDANGREDSSGFRTFGKGQYFSALELGYRQIINNPSSDNYHIFIWQTSARPQMHLRSDSGYSIILQKNFNNRFLPFLKVAGNQGKTRAVKSLIMGGFGLHHPFNAPYGLLGFGVGYVTLTPLAFEEEEDAMGMEEEHMFMPYQHYEHEKEESHGGHQVIFETFYRIQLSPYTQLTPDIQVIKTLPYEHYKARWATVANIRLRTAI